MCVNICRSNTEQKQTSHHVPFPFLKSADAPLSSLQELCRVSIRRILRSFIHQEHPDLNHRPKRQKKPKKKRRRQQQLNVVPMSMGMMILGQFEESDTSDIEDSKQFDSDQSHSEDDEVPDTLEKSDSDEDEDEYDGYNDAVGELPVPDSMSDAEKDSQEHAHACNDVELLEVDTEVKSENAVNMNVQKPATDGGNIQSTASSTPTPNSTEGKTAIKRVGKAISTKLGEISSKLKSDVKQNTTHENRHHQKMKKMRNHSSDDSSEDLNFDFDFPEMFHHNAASSFVLGKSSKLRCSSNTSNDTSETSGFGSLSDDHLDAEMGKYAPEKLSPGGASLEEETTNQLMDCSEQEVADKVMKPNIRMYMRTKIETLPLPQALKCFLMYYRN